MSRGEWGSHTEQAQGRDRGHRTSAPDVCKALIKPVLAPQRRPVRQIASSTRGRYQWVSPGGRGLRWEKAGARMPLSQALLLGEWGQVLSQSLEPQSLERQPRHPAPFSARPHSTPCASLCSECPGAALGITPSWETWAHRDFIILLKMMMEFPGPGTAPLAQQRRPRVLNPLRHQGRAACDSDCPRPG